MTRPGQRWFPVLAMWSALSLTAVPVLAQEARSVSVASRTETSLAEAQRAVRSRDWAGAIARYRPLAEQGNPEAQVQLAALLRAGRGMPADPAQAVAWLEKAARSGHADAQYALATALEHGRGVPADPARARHWLRTAAKQGHRAAARRLDADTSGSPRRGDRSESPSVALARAAQRGDAGAVRRALERGVSPAADALLTAADRGHADVIRVLLGAGLSPEARGPHRETALLLAARRGHDAAVDLLLGAGANANAADDRGTTPLHAASRASHAGVVGRLLVAGARVNARDAEGRTPLELARRGGHRSLVARLQAAGGRSGTRSRATHSGSGPVRMQGTESALIVHARRGDEDAVAKLLESGVTPEEMREALRRAAAHGEARVIGRLLDAGARVGAVDAAGASAIHHAVSGGHREACSVLLRRGADPEQRGPDGATPLALAARHGDEALIGLLLEAGAKADSAALHAAVARKHTGAALRLIAAGASPIATNAAGRGPACVAARVGSAEILGRLLAAGAPANAMCGDVPLLHAAAGSPSALRVVLETGSDPNQAAPDGSTALHVAAAQGVLLTAQLLVDAGTDVERRGATAPYRADAGGGTRPPCDRRAAAVGGRAAEPPRRERNDGGRAGAPGGARSGERGARVRAGQALVLITSRTGAPPRRD